MSHSVLISKDTFALTIKRHSAELGLGDGKGPEEGLFVRASRLQSEGLPGVNKQSREWTLTLPDLSKRVGDNSG